LDGPRDEQRLVVMGGYSDLTHKDLTRNAKFSSTAVKIATIEPNGIVHPAGDGDTFVTIEANGKKAQVPVHVQRSQADVPVRFAREVIPVLTQAGLN